MKKSTLLKIAICIFAHLGISRNAFAQEAFDFSRVVGRHDISSCVFTRDFQEEPSEYYCHMKSLKLKQTGENSFSLSFTNELGEIHEVDEFSEYTQNSSGLINEAEFINFGNSTTWSMHYKDLNSKVEIYESYEFTKNNRGEIKMNHSFSYQENNIKKTYSWDYELN